MLERLERLIERIEAYGKANGWDSVGNYVERRNENGEIYWRQTDWEFVDNFHNTIYNENYFGYNGDTLKKLNEMWDRYRPYDESSFMGIGVPGSVLINNEKY